MSGAVCLTRAGIAALVLALAAASASAPLGAQGRPSARPDARLAARLDAAAVAAVGAQLDSARAAGVPTEPLVQKALQGAAKRVPSGRIVHAVRALRGELATARGALGADASEPELVAAAGAVHGGAGAAALRDVRDARRGKPLTVALATLTDLVALGVPVDSAASTVVALARRGATDDDIVAVREGVEADVAAGAEPAAAARARSGRARSGSAEGRAEGRVGGPPSGRGNAGARGPGAGKGAPPSVPRRPDRPKKPKP